MSGITFKLNKMNTEQERQALQNMLNHFNIDLILVSKEYSDARVKAKWFLILDGSVGLSSPTLDYNQMQHFILGMGAGMTNKQC